MVLLGWGGVVLCCAVLCVIWFGLSTSNLGRGAIVWLVIVMLHGAGQLL